MVSTFFLAKDHAFEDQAGFSDNVLEHLSPGQRSAANLHRFTKPGMYSKFNPLIFYFADRAIKAMLERFHSLLVKIRYLVLTVFQEMNVDLVEAQV
jgi:hypothetical protein